MSRSIDRNYSKVDLTFDQTVTISESYYPSPSLTVLLADMGGSLGLWLGVGIIQLFAYASNFANIKIQNMNLI